MNSLHIGFVGDVALAGEYLQTAKPPGSPLTFPFESLDQSFKWTDIFVLNLEGPIGCKGRPRKRVTSILHNEPEIVPWLKRFPVCVCNLANNHMMDYGAEALIRTRQVLMESGIHCVGAGVNAVEAARPLVVDIEGSRLGFMSYTTDEPHVGAVLAETGSPGCASMKNTAEVLDLVRETSSCVDTLVVSLHWGYEYHLFPTPAQTFFARRLVDSGASLVIGHHPHVLQGIERYGHGLIAYSLGNFILPELKAADGRLQYRKPVTKQFAILKAEVGDSQVRSWMLEGGKCTQGYELLPYSASVTKEFNAFMHVLSDPLLSPEYFALWEHYRRNRVRQLQREELKEAFLKFMGTDWPTLFSTFSAKDLHRNFLRLARLFSINVGKSS